MFTSTLRNHYFAYRIVFCFVLGAALCSASQTAMAQGHSSERTKSAEQSVYEDDHLFDQLSGAARTRAEHKFGRKFKGKKRQKPPPLDDDFRGTDGDFSDGMWGDPLGAFSALPNPLVNDPTTDTTTQDTQSETTLIVAGGSNVVCGFNDSALFNDTTTFKFTGFSQSTNGGLSWTDRGSLPTNPDGDAGDPTMAYSKKT